MRRTILVPRQFLALCSALIPILATCRDARLAPTGLGLARTLDINPDLTGSMGFSPLAVAQNSASAFTVVTSDPIVPTVFNTDFVAAGVGAMRNQPGPHAIRVGGVSGSVKKAHLYWQGPTNSTSPGANAHVFLNGAAVTGRNIGFSSDGCWGFLNSQAYTADVTAIVAANGTLSSTDSSTYVLTGFGTGSVNTNGASLLLFYDDGNAANNRDIVVQAGNDANLGNSFDPPGISATLTGILYSGGPARLQLHIADGQISYPDGALVINGVTKIPASEWISGFSVPGMNNGPAGNGRLWDIKRIDVAPDLSAAGPAPQTLQVQNDLASDCLNLVVAAFDLPRGAAPGNVTVDIRPEAEPNFVNLGSDGNLPLAILSTVLFDATTVDPRSVRFGPAGVPEAHGKGHLDDVNGDGRVDMLLHVEAQASGLTAAAIEGCLDGQTVAGAMIHGCDAIRVVPGAVKPPPADRTPPTGSITSGPSPNSAFISAGSVGNFTIAATDDVSGFSSTPLSVIVTRTNAAGTSCVIGSGAGCTVPAARPAIFDPLDGTGAPTNEGYYSVSITLGDQAGNSTSLVSGLVFLSDDPMQTAPGASADIGVLGSVSVPVLLVGAATNTFTVFSADDLDLASVWGVTTYPTASIRHVPQSIGTFGPPLTTGSTVSYAVANWIRCLNGVGDFATISNKPHHITLTVSDQAGNSFSQPSPQFGGSAQSCGAVGDGMVTSFGSVIADYGVGKASVDIDGVNMSAASSASVGLRVTADVPLVPGVNPFSRVDFYYQSAAGPLVLIGTGNAAMTQTAISRTWAYDLTWNPDATVPVGTVAVVAIGVDAEGDAVLSGAIVLTTVP